MKHLYILIFTVFYFQLIQGQIIDIPDANFKNALVNFPVIDTDGDHFPDSNADLNNDGEIQISEAESVLNLKLFFLQISSIQGIEYFINLEYLDISANQLTNVSPLYNLTNLKILDCNSNFITELDLSNLINLEDLNCAANLLSNLDVNSLVNLKELGSHYNQLNHLNVSGLTQLEILDCSNNELTSLDLSSLLSLQMFYCSYNNLSELNLGGLLNLNTVYCQSNQLTYLEVSGCNELEFLECSYNILTNINISGAVNLYNFFASYNQLITLDLSDANSLWEVSLFGNQLTTLDFSNTSVSILTCSNNQLTSLIIKNGVSSNSAFLSFDNNPNLNYICADDDEIDDVNIKINEYNYNNCVTDSNCNLSTIQIEKKDVTLYPNPVKDILYIEAQESIKSIEVYNLNGSLLQKKVNVGNGLENQINLKYLQAGIYFVKIKSEKTDKAYKIVKN